MKYVKIKYLNMLLYLVSLYILKRFVIVIEDIFQMIWQLSPFLLVPMEGLPIASSGLLGKYENREVVRRRNRFRISQLYYSVNAGSIEPLLVGDDEVWMECVW